MTARRVRKLAIIGIVAALMPAVFLVDHPAAAQTTITVRDEFRTVSYAGNDGSIDFSGPWRERGEGDGPGAGVIRVEPDDRCAGGVGYCLRMGLTGGTFEPFAVDRAADLEGATEAALSFTWRRDTQGQVNGAVRVRVSGNGGVSWTTLKTIALAGSQSTSSESFDISPWAGNATVIRFDGTGTDVNGHLTVDDVQVQAVIAPATSTTTVPGSTTTTTTAVGTTTTTVPGTTSTTAPGPTTTTTTTTVPGATTTTVPGTTSTTIPGVTVTTTVPGTTTTDPRVTATTTTEGPVSTTVASGTTSSGAPPSGPTDTGSEPSGPVDEPAAGHATRGAADASPQPGDTEPATGPPLALVATQLVILGLLAATLAIRGVATARPPNT